jgi:predicted 3-demethylubiquinone-9 3-methyltransferase (glyoxalase superfamily)
MQKFVPFLMFTGQAEEAIQFYTSLFGNSEVTRLSRYKANEAGTEGSIQHASFTLNGQEFMAIDSNVEHGFTFTPSLSIYVRCKSEAEIDNAFSKLSEGGQVLMPLDHYPFSKKFGWVADKYGVSWQLSLDGP